MLSPILYAVFVDGIVDRLEKAGCVGSLVGSETVRCLLYADDICLIADSAADLQRMLSVSQKFADESSFQFSMEKSQVVVFGPDAGDRFADEFRLMGTPMDVVSEYKYLGLILHESLGRRTGPGSGLAYGAEKEKYLYKRLLDNDEERVVVDIFEDDSVSRRQLVAKTRLLVDNKPAPGEERVQFYHVSETLDEVISAYRAANPKVKQTDYVHLRAWDLVSEIGRHQRSFSPEIRNDLTRDAQHDERGFPGFVDGR